MALTPLSRGARHLRIACLLLGAALAVAPVRAAPQSWVSRDGDLAWRMKLRVGPGETVENDLLGLGGPIVVEGTVFGDVVAVNGDVVVRGRVEGDALSVLGRVRLEGGEVTGNVFAIAGGVDGDRSSVHGQVREIVPVGVGERPSYLGIAYSRTGLIVLLLAILFWVLAALVASLAAPSAVVAASAQVRRHPVRLVLIGLLLHVSLLLTLVLFVALVAFFVGIPLLLLLMVGWTALKAAGLAVSFHALGDRLTDRLRQGPTSGYVKVLVGALVLAAVAFVPYLGLLSWFVAYCAGAAAIVTGRLRQPSPHSS